MADQLTQAQIWAALATVAALLGWSNALYKNIFGKNLGETIRTSIMKRWFSTAIFRKDVLNFMDNMQLQLNEIKAELKHNGGSSVKDAVVRLEGGHDRILEKVEVLAENVEHLKGLRDIYDRFESVMKFKYDPEQGFVSISDSFLNAFGCKESDVMYYGYAELIHPEDVEDMWQKMYRAIETKTPFTDTWRIKDSMGIYHKTDVKAKPIIIAGKIKEYVGIIELSSH